MRAVRRDTTKNLSIPPPASPPRYLPLDLNRT
jgi:hypothetical protein